MKSYLMNRNWYWSIVCILLPFTNIALALVKTNCYSYNIVEIFSFSEMITLILVAVAEEAFFRGLVLHEMVFGYHWRPFRSSLIVSIVFGILHLLNANSYATWSYVIVQSICAFAVSFNICALYINTKSLLWCVVIHALINISSVFAEYGGNTEQLVLCNYESLIYLVVSLVYLVIGTRMFMNKLAEGNE